MAEILDQSYSESNQDTFINLRYSSYDSLRVGQTILSSYSGTLTKITLFVKRVGTISGNIFATVYATSAGEPTGSALATSNSIDAGSLGISFALQDFTFSTPANISSGVTYCIALEGDYSISNFNYIQVGADFSSPTYPNGQAYWYLTSSWSALSGYDLCFYEYVTPTNARSKGYIY